MEKYRGEKGIQIEHKVWYTRHYTFLLADAAEYLQCNGKLIVLPNQNSNFNSLVKPST